MPRHSAVRACAKSGLPRLAAAPAKSGTASRCWPAASSRWRKKRRPMNRCLMASKPRAIAISLCRITAAKGGNMPKTFFVVRSTVKDAAQRQKFDHWYSTDHMPWAIKEFKAEKAWRFWSETDPAIHQATYQFVDK